MGNCEGAECKNQKEHCRGLCVDVDCVEHGDEQEPEQGEERACFVGAKLKLWSAYRAGEDNEQDRRTKQQADDAGGGSDVEIGVVGVVVDGEVEMG